MRASPRYLLRSASVARCRSPLRRPFRPGAEAPGLPGRRPGDPTLRCCVGLQRMTGRRSRSFGLSASPASFRLTACTLASSDDPLPVGCPSGGSPLMTFRSPSRTSPCVLCARPDRSSAGLPFFAYRLPWSSLPLRRSQSGESVSRPGLSRPVPRAPVARFAGPVPFRPCLAAGFHARVVRLRRFSRP